MKRFAALTILILVAISLKAQTERMPFGGGSSYYLSTKNEANAAYRPSKGSILFEDFEGSSLTNSWEIKRSDDLSGNNLGSAVSPQWFICTSASFMGNGSTYIHFGNQSVAIAYTAEKCTWLYRKDTLAIPDEGNTSLDFWLWYSNDAASGIVTNFHTMVYDVDAQKWDTLATWGKDSTSNQYARKISLSLSGFKGKRIRFAFVYQNIGNSGNQVAIDDVVVGENTTPDLAIRAIPFTYSMVPVFLIDTFRFSLYSYVSNYGTRLEDTATVKVTSPQLAELSSSAEVTDTLEAGEIRFVKAMPQARFKNPGSYKLYFDVEAEQDQNPLNNRDSIRFAVSDMVYATDHGAKGGFTLGRDQEFGNIYPVPNHSFINRIRVYWAAFDNGSSFTPFEFQLSLYQLNPVDSTIMRTLYQETLLKEASFSGVFKDFYIDPVYCTPGISYLVAVKQLGTKSLGVGFDGLSTGSFWKKVGSEPGRVERMTNPTIGNVAIELIMGEPDLTPSLSFTVKYKQDPISGIKIKVEGFDPIITNQYGNASLELPNGLYKYSIVQTGYSPVREQVRVLYQDVNLSIALDTVYKTKFQVKSNGTAVAGAEILIADSVCITNAQGIDSIFLQPGSYQYTVTASGFDSYQALLEITSKDTIVNLNLSTAVTYRVNLTVVDERNKPVEQAEVNFGSLGVKTTNNMGKVDYVGVKPSPTAYNYIISKYGFENKSGNVTVTDKDVSVDVTLIAMRYNAVFCVTGGNSALVNAVVTVTGSNPVTTNALGLAAVQGIAPGVDIPYSVALTGYHTLNGKITVVDSDIRIDVSLTPVSAPSIETEGYAVFPNPSDGLFTVKGLNGYSVAVYDLTGKCLYSRSGLTGNHALDIRERPAGIYFVRIIDGSKAITRRVIKR